MTRDLDFISPLIFHSRINDMKVLVYEGRIMRINFRDQAVSRVSQLHQIIPRCWNSFVLKLRQGVNRLVLRRISFPC